MRRRKSVAMIPKKNVFATTANASGTSSHASPRSKKRNQHTSTARWMLASFSESKKWSSHSPARLPPPVSRASCPSAESSAYPSTSSPHTSSDDQMVGSSSAMSATPVRVHSALTTVTCDGVIRRANAVAANGRPSGRLT